MILTIPDLPVMPYVRMTQKGKWSSPRAQEYLANRSCLEFGIKRALSEGGHYMLPAQTPLWIAIIYVAPREQGHRCDTDNLLKAVLDACNGIVYPDDRWIDSISIRRYFGNPHLSIEVATMSERKVE